MKFKPVSIPLESFYFCRYGVAVLLWLAVSTGINWIVVITFLIFIISALVGVDKAPMIVLFTHTLGKFNHNLHMIVVDKYDIRFVHSLAATINGIILLLFVFGLNPAAKIILIIFACLKTLSAVGYCPASKLRTCVLGSQGKCCSVSRFITLKKSC